MMEFEDSFSSCCNSAVLALPDTVLGSPWKTAKEQHNKQLQGIIYALRRSTELSPIS